LKKYFIQYTPFLLFLAKFFVTYIVLTFIYQGFLRSFDEDKIDSITELVAENTKQLLTLFNTDADIVKNNSESYIRLIYDQHYVARMIEGCNGISVIILFISFVVSFSGKLKPTLFFILGGSLIIYALNVARIAALSVLLYFFPKQGPLLHGVFFPLFIYGVVFILWVIWVNKFSLYAKNTANL
jgi:exosortase family protein XrtF